MPEPRVFVIELPPGLELLNSNDRRNRYAQNRLGQAILTAAWAKALGQKVPELKRAHIVGIHRPVNNRVRDAANMYPSFKACVDGLVKAGVLSNDDDAHVVGPDMVTGPIDEAAKARKLKHGSLILVLTELPATQQEADCG
jgi:hypothetical protein